MGGSWRVSVDEAIHMKMKEPGSGREQLGSIMQVKSATGNYLTKKTGNWTTSKEAST